jgi:hypothetical protein
MNANGPVVWGVAVCVGVPRFLPPDSYRDPVGGRLILGHDKLS